MSSIITVTTAEDGTKSASIEEANLADIVTTVFSNDQALTGTYGLVQKGLLVVGGMSLQSQRIRGSWNPL